MKSDVLRAWVEVDLAALARNARALRRHAAVPLLPMVKADAYGLGVAAVVRALEVLGPWGFGVATLDEGAELRALGVRLPIVVFTPALKWELRDLREHHLRPAIGAAHLLSDWLEIGGGAWHLAIDTGMTRAGVRWDRIGELASLSRRSPPEGAFTHFHSAELDDDSMREQEHRFATALAGLPERPALCHAENSAAIVRHDRSPWDLVRPGIFLYGVGSGDTARLLPENVVSLRGRIVEMHDVDAGATVSYDATWRSPDERRIATVALGYADGYRRAFGNAGHVIVKGCRVPVRGVVTMDMTMVDVSGVDCEVGDTVTFIGRDGDEQITVQEAGAIAGVSPYELLTGMHGRSPRVYTSSLPG